MAKNRPAFWRHPVRAVSPLLPQLCTKSRLTATLPSHILSIYYKIPPAARGRGWLAYGREQQGISVYPHGREVASGAGGKGLHLSAQGERAPAAQGGGGLHPHALPHAGGLSGLHSPAGGAAAGALRRDGGLEPGACAIPAASGGFFCVKRFGLLRIRPGWQQPLCAAARNAGDGVPYRGGYEFAGGLTLDFAVCCRAVGTPAPTVGAADAPEGCGWRGQSGKPEHCSAKPQPRYPMNRSNKPSALPLAHPASPKTTTRRGICPGQDHRTPIVQKEGAAPCIHPLLPSGPATRWGCF